MGDEWEDHCFNEHTGEKHTHVAGIEWKSDTSNHWKVCKVNGCSAILENTKAAHTASEWIIDTAATAATDGTKHKECTVCERVLETDTIPATGSDHTHSFAGEWKTDTDKHWHECSCGVKSEKATHTASGWITDTAATATTDGTKHKECTECGYVMETGTIPATGSDHTHSYGSDWKSNADKHWLECACGVKSEEAAHTAGDWITDTAATSTTAGTKHKECTVCHRVLETGTIPATGTGAFPFVDVDTDDWFFEDVAYVYDKGLMNGVGDNLFAPEISTDRAMIVTILWRMEGCPVVNYAMNFTDVQEDQWYTEAIRWAEATGLVKGYGNGLFGTTAPITVEQAAAILHRYAANKGWTDDTTVPMLPAYTYSEWAENDVIWAELSGIFSGVGTGLDDLTAAASRAEIASFLRRFCEDIAK